MTQLKNYLFSGFMVVSMGTTGLFADDSTQEGAKYPQYNNRMAVFEVIHQLYERTKNDAFYVGVDVWEANRIGGNAGAFGEAELRMGYNFFYNGRDHVTPLVGIGAFKDFHHFEEYEIEYSDSGISTLHEVRKRKAAVLYGTLGFKYCHEFNSIFNLGADLKGLLGGSVDANKLSTWGGAVWGVDVAMPITFRFGHKRHWDLRIEPFDIYMHGSERAENYFGFRSTLGYRF